MGDPLHALDVAGRVDPADVVLLREREFGLGQPREESGRLQGAIDRLESGGPLGVRAGVVCLKDAVPVKDGHEMNRLRKESRVLDRVAVDTGISPGRSGTILSPREDGMCHREGSGRKVALPRRPGEAVRDSRTGYECGDACLTFVKRLW
jgi:hypothetical protein